MNSDTYTSTLLKIKDQLDLPSNQWECVNLILRDRKIIRYFADDNGAFWASSYAGFIEDLFRFHPDVCRWNPRNFAESYRVENDVDDGLNYEISGTYSGRDFGKRIQWYGDKSVPVNISAFNGVTRKEIDDIFVLIRDLYLRDYSPMDIALNCICMFAMAEDAEILEGLCIAEEHNCVCGLYNAFNVTNIENCPKETLLASDDQTSFADVANDEYTVRSINFCQHSGHFVATKSAAKV